MEETRQSLERALLAAHNAGDKPALVGLYTRAAQLADGEDARGFFLTQAFVFALDTGAPEATPLRAELAAMGREVKEDSR
ncbi:MAG: hypothetical protein ACWA47_08510 [Brevirhabdus sp.]